VASGSAIAQLRAGLRVQLRTIFALILRETRVRYGRSRIGYAWALIEPIAIVTFFTLAVSGFLGRRQFSTDFGVFVALGVINYQFFRHASNFIALSIEANTPLFNYPSVHEFDAALARLILDSATYFTIFWVIFGFIVLVFGATYPAHPQAMLLSYFGLGLLALGVGLNLAALQRRFEMAVMIYGLITTPMLFLTPVLYSLESLPTDMRNFLVWNPIAHGVEGMRHGYYVSYGSTYVSFSYLYMVAIILIGIGMVQVLLTRRGMR
jgi:capsular polysaccharide transport system permease protein